MSITKEKKQIGINPLVQIAFNGLESRNTLVGKKVIYKGDDINKRLKKDHIYTIKKLSIGNYHGFIYLEEIPERSYSEYSRCITPNTYNIKEFVLLDNPIYYETV